MRKIFPKANEKPRKKPRKLVLTSGVYILDFGGCVYVGSSIDVTHRFYSHIKALHNNKHLYFQSHFDKAKFKAKILTYCKDDERKRLEQDYIDYYKRICKVLNKSRAYIRYRKQT